MRKGGDYHPPTPGQGNITGSPAPNGLAHHHDITIFFFLALNFSPICGV